MRQPITMCVSAILALMAAGCAALPLATLGTIFGIADTAATAGPSVYQMGKLDTAFMVDFPTLQAAVRSAAGDLGLHIARDRAADNTRDVWDFQLQDDLKAKIEITLRRRAARLSRCRVNVGIFGSEPTARLLMNRIAAHLPKQASS